MSVQLADDQIPNVVKWLFCQRSLAIREKALGPEHPDVATSLNSLALLYQAQGKYRAAEPLYRRSLSVREKSLGLEHPEVAQSLENYAALLREMGRPEEAEELEPRAHAIRAKHARQNPVSRLSRPAAEYGNVYPLSAISHSKRSAAGLACPRRDLS